MKITNGICFALAATIALFVAACSPAGGPSAGTEADQSVSASHQAAKQWAREDLISRSSTGNIQMPAPGLIIQALNSIQETTLPPDGVSFPDEVADAVLGRNPPNEDDLARFQNEVMFPKVEVLQKTSLHLMSAKEFAEAVAEIAKAKDPAKAWVEREGPVTAAITWEGVQAGDLNEVDAQMAHIRMALSAAAWCRTATQSTSGWPVPAMSNRSRDRKATVLYIIYTQATIESCANLVAKIVADLGPIAYADQSALQMAVYQRLIAFTPDQLQAMEVEGMPRDLRIDETGVKGQAFNSSEGRFENPGSGWTWKRGNVVYLDGANVFGRAVTVSLASAASGTMRQAITGNQSLSANAMERAKAAVQVGPPK